MATKPIKPSEKLGLNTTPMLRARVQTGENWARGAVLAFVSGFLQEAGANPTNALGIAASSIPATGGTGTTADQTTFAPFYPALPHVAFEGTVLGNGATQVALDNTMLFGSYGLTADTTGNWYVDVSKGAVSNFQRVRIIEFVDDSGTIDGRVVFTFLSTANWLAF